MPVLSATAARGAIVVNVCSICGRSSATYSGAIPRGCWALVRGKFYCQNPRGKSRCFAPVVAKGRA